MLGRSPFHAGGWQRQCIVPVDGFPGTPFLSIGHPTLLGFVSRRFLSVLSFINTGRSAVWLARLVWNQEVAGSNPAVPILGVDDVAQLGERWCLAPEVKGSTPFVIILAVLGLSGRLFL